MNTVIEFLKVILARIEAGSPELFVKIRKVAGVVAILLFAVVLCDNYVADIIGDGLNRIFEIADYIIATVFAFAWLPVDEPMDLKVTRKIRIDRRKKRKKERKKK